MPERKNQLVNMDIKEVSGVGSPANMRKFLIVKSAEVEGKTLVEKLQNIVKRYLPPKGNGARTFAQSYAYETLDDQLSDMMYNAQYALRDSIKSILADPNVADKISAINQSLNDFSSVVSTGITQALNTIGASSVTTGTTVTTTKSEEGHDMPDKNNSITDELLKGLPEEAQQAIKKLQADAAKVADLEKQVEELKKGQDKGDEGQVDLFKGMSPEQRAHFEKMQKRAEEAERIAKEEREARLRKEYIQKAQELSGLNISAEEFGPILKSAAEKLPEEEFTKLHEVLKSASKVIETSSIFKEQGRDGAGEDTALAELEKKAEELRKADSSLTKEAAFTKAMQEYPELYERYKRGE